MIKDIVQSILTKHLKRASTFLKPTITVPKRKPLPITTGIPERFPVYKSFYHILFPKSFERTYQLKREFLERARNTPLPHVRVPSQTKTLILNTSVTDLLTLLNDDQITSQQILYTYLERAQSIGIEMNYITDLNVEEAFEDARCCDKIRSETPKSERSKLGLLFGIPISIKENIPQRGFDSTCGLATHCFKPYNKDSLAVELVRKEGGIPFARSTVPQLLSVIETISNIWGRANNPWDNSRSTGGSSGGEAGLIAMRCSPLGVGTDGLGSLRIPANWCGIYSFKPTSGRLSWKQSAMQLNYLSEARWSVLYPSIGPMGRSVDDIILMTRCLSGKENHDRDPNVTYVEWSTKGVEITKKLKVGYVVSEELFGASKANRRAVLEAIEELRRQGHEVEEVKIPNFDNMIRMTLAFMTSDGMSKGNILALNGEKLIDELKVRLVFSIIPGWLRRRFMPLLRTLGEERAAFLGNWTAGLSGDQWQWILHEKDQAGQQLFNFWKEKEFDAIITPGSALPALQHGTSGELALNCCYLWLANMFNLPAGIVPVTKVREDEEQYGKEESVFKDWLQRQAVDAMKNSAGLPVGVQVLTLPYQDEKCLGIMKLLEGKFPAMTKM